VTRRIAIIQGHPDTREGHFCRALADVYAKSAAAAGHQVRVVEVAGLDFPMLRSKDDWERGSPVAAIRQAQETIGWAEHLVIFYPLWLGGLPALLKAFLEQVLRPGFALSQPGEGKPWTKLLKGRSARIVVTMGMPAIFYRWYFGAHSLRSFERNILGFCGIGPISESLVGMIESKDPGRREKWLAKMRKFGKDGS
jgi:putative NADPH-quinone reductase